MSRIAIGLPLYLAGERFPKWSPDDPRSHNYNDIGDSILYDHGHYLRNLSLARSAILPFFAITAVVVFLWTRREFGDFAGLAAAVLFTTLPIVLAFSGMAYTDVPHRLLAICSFFCLRELAGEAKLAIDTSARSYARLCVVIEDDDFVVFSGHGCRDISI